MTNWNKTSFNNMTYKNGISAPQGYKFVVNNMNYSNTTFPCVYLIKKEQSGQKCVAPWAPTIKT